MNSCLTLYRYRGLPIDIFIDMYIYTAYYIHIYDYFLLCQLRVPKKVKIFL